jgi:hypothetical protein
MFTLPVDRLRQLVAFVWVKNSTKFRELGYNRGMKKIILPGLLLFLSVCIPHAKSKAPEAPFVAKQISIDGVSIVRLTDTLHGISYVPSR